MSKISRAKPSSKQSQRPVSAVTYLPVSIKTIAQIPDELDKISRVDQLSISNKENTFNAMRAFHTKIKAVIKKELMKDFWLSDTKNT